jgi:hypothetical protein
MNKYFPLLFCIFLPLQSFCSESGFQIVGELPEECSLLNTLQTLSEEEQKAQAPEFYSILTQLKERIAALMHGGCFIQCLLHEEIGPEEALCIFGPCLGIENYQTNSYVQEVFRCSFSPQFFFTLLSDKAKVSPENYFTEIELEEIYQTAKAIVKATQSGDHLICLGQSPAYIIEAVEELSDRYIHKVPFSGAPDYFYLNRHYKSLKLSNIVTPTSLEYYKQVLKEKGVSPTQLGSRGNIFVIDLVGTGGGIASFLKLMAQWYASLEIPLPDFKLMDISVANRNFKNLTQIVLPLSDTCQIHIGRYFIHTSAHLSDTLDYTEGEDRIVPPFGALLWKPEYEHVYHQYPNDYAQKVIECVREYVRKRNSTNIPSSSYTFS